MEVKLKMNLEDFKRVYLKPACDELARKLIHSEPLTEVEKPIFLAWREGLK